MIHERHNFLYLAKHFRYCGEYFDEESGFIYLRNRYYDPSIGAFINEDPIRDGLNWYVYCSGNPVMFVDPSGYLKTGYDEEGVWHDWDAEKYGKDSAKYKMLVGLTTAYESATTDEDRKRIHQLAETLRVTDTTITDAMLLNNSKGAFGSGHNGLVLVNSSGQGFLFSYNPIKTSFYNIGEMRFSILSDDDMIELKDRSGVVKDAVTIDGNCRTEDGDAAYDRFIWTDISTTEGNNMFLKAADIFNDPGRYAITGNQCDNVTSDILSAGNKGYFITSVPNNLYNSYKKDKTNWINENGVNRGVKP